MLEKKKKLVVSVYGVMDSHVKILPFLINRLFRFKELNDSMNDSIKISPLFSEHLDCLPKVLMIEAEFDYFKICNEEFVKKLEEQGKDVDVTYKDLFSFHDTRLY